MSWVERVGFSAESTTSRIAREITPAPTYEDVRFDQLRSSLLVHHEYGHDQIRLTKS